jgi:hypothetical protein
MQSLSCLGFGLMAALDVSIVVTITAPWLEETADSGRYLLDTLVSNQLFPVDFLSQRGFSPKKLVHVGQIYISWIVIHCSPN